MSGRPDNRMGRRRGLAGGLLLLHTVLSTAMLIAAEFWPRLGALLGGDDIRAYAVGGLLMQGLLILLPALLFVVGGRILHDDVFGEGPIPTGTLVLSATAGIPAAVVFQGINNLSVYALVRLGIRLPVSLPFTDPGANTGASESAIWLPIALAVGCFLPGLAEELFFRGVIQSQLDDGPTTAAAVFWQAVSFALFHVDARFLAAPLLAGLMLGHIRRSSGSLWPAILTHITMNVTLLFLPPLLPRLTAPYLSGLGSRTASLLYASLFASLVAAAALLPLLILIGSFGRRPVQRQKRRITAGDGVFAFALLIQAIAVLWLG